MSATTSNPTPTLSNLQTLAGNVDAAFTAYGTAKTQADASAAQAAADQAAETQALTALDQAIAALVSAAQGESPDGGAAANPPPAAPSAGGASTSGS